MISQLYVETSYKFKMKKIITMLLSVLLFTGNVLSINATEKEVVQFDLTSIEELTQIELDNETFPGASVLIKLGDDVLYNESFGYSYLYDMGTKLSNPIITTNETIYDLASVTKVTATTQAMMMLVYQKKLDLDKPISEYWQGFGENGKEQITARDLLTHTSGLTPWEATFLYGNTRAQEKRYIENLQLEYQTGSKYAYSDFSFMSLAFLLEEITGQSIEDFLQENLYGPLGMMDTMYTPLDNGADISRIAATSWGNPYEWRMSNEADYPGYGYDTSKDAEAFLNFHGWREYTLVGEVNDGNAGMANEGIAGHAGLFSTTGDLSILADLMLQGGTLNGITIYDQETIDIFTAADSERFGRGLGWQVGGARENSGYVGKYATENVYSHAGFTGTQFIVDGEYGLSVTILTNKQNSGHIDGKYKSPYAYSRSIMNLVYEQIQENELSLREALESKVPIENQTYDVEEYNAYLALIEKIGTQDLDELKYPELKSIYDEIEKLEHSLVPLDFTELDTLISEVNQMKEDNYTKESWIKLQSVIGVIQTEYSTFNTHLAIEEAVKELKEAINNLIPRFEVLFSATEVTFIANSVVTEEEFIQKLGIQSDYPVSIQSDFNDKVDITKIGTYTVSIVLNPSNRMIIDQFPYSTNVVVHVIEDETNGQTSLPKTGENTQEKILMSSLLIIMGIILFSQKRKRIKN